MPRAKKSLGQNFLKSEVALKKIVEMGEISSGDVILEIGPGRGALSEKLLEKINSSLTLPKGEGTKTGFVIAVEKDRELFEFLKTRFEKEIETHTLVLVCEDILNFNVEKIIKNFNYKIIANIPYNITGAILKKFLTAEHQPERMVLMVQQEVAKRIVARDGKESILSISVKAYGEPRLIMKVPARYFSPAPKVDSAIIVINNISRKNFPPLLVEEGVGGGDSKENHLAFGTPPQKGGEGNFEEKFWKIVKTGFAHKRKKLSSNLKVLKHGGVSSLETLGNKRAEDLSLADWISLAKA